MMNRQVVNEKLILLVKWDSLIHDNIFFSFSVSISFEKRSIADPLVEMKGYLKTKEKVSELSQNPPPTTSTSLSSTGSRQPTLLEIETKESHKHKKKKKKARKEEKEMMMMKLREDRRRREAEERARAEKLMKRHYGLEVELPPSKTIEEIPGR